MTLVVLGIVVGAAVVLFAGSRVWNTVLEVRPSPLPPVEIHRTGGRVLPVLPALGLVALACAGGLLATRGVARRVVGAVLGTAAVAMIVLIVSALARDDVAAGWPALGLAGAGLVAVTAAVAVVHGGRWPVMGSRYSRAPGRTADRPGSGSAAVTAKDTELWDAMDRGEDPTRDDPDDR